MREEFFEYDAPVVIPDEIKNKTKEELEAEIKELEEKAFKERDRIRANKKSVTA